VATGLIKGITKGIEFAGLTIAHRLKEKEGLPQALNRKKILFLG